MDRESVTKRERSMAEIKRNVFYSFHYDADNWRASQVRNMGVIEGNTPCSDNDWESVKKGGDAAIERWIVGQLSGRSCAVVLVGNQTAGRKWITYEISKAWNASKGVVGIRIHGLKDRNGYVANAGGNPFDYVTLNRDNSRLSTVVKLHDPTDWIYGSTGTYSNIKRNLSNWIEEAIQIRDSH
jgi:hypothetical protein